jgi:hypothetical protein
MPLICFVALGRMVGSLSLYLVLFLPVFFFLSLFKNQHVVSRCRVVFDPHRDPNSSLTRKSTGMTSPQSTRQDTSTSITTDYKQKHHTFPKDRKESKGKHDIKNFQFSIYNFFPSFSHRLQRDQTENLSILQRQDRTRHKNPTSLHRLEQEKQKKTEDPRQDMLTISKRRGREGRLEILI